jgi:hypothetical protein
MASIEWVGEVLAKQGYGVLTREFLRPIVDHVKLIPKEDYVKPEDKYDVGLWAEKAITSMSMPEGEEPVLPAADDPQAIIAGLREQLAALGGQVEQLMAGNVEIAGLAEQRIAAAETESAQAKAAAAEVQSKLTAAETALVSARQATLHPAINGEVLAEKSDAPKGDAVIVRMPDGTQFQVPPGRKMFVIS